MHEVAPTRCVCGGATSDKGKPTLRPVFLRSACFHSPSHQFKQQVECYGEHNTLDCPNRKNEKTLRHTGPVQTSNPSQGDYLHELLPSGRMI